MTAQARLLSNVSRSRSTGFAFRVARGAFLLVPGSVRHYTGIRPFALHLVAGDAIRFVVVIPYRGLGLTNVALETVTIAPRLDRMRNVGTIAATG